MKWYVSRYMKKMCKNEKNNNNKMLHEIVKAHDFQHKDELSIHNNLLLFPALFFFY